MIIRIVRMHIIPEKADEFVEIFERTRDAIRNARGCSHLELLRDTEHTAGFTTFSHWDSKTDLEEYRNSELFKTVWARVKPMFRKPAEASSLERFIGT